MQYVSTRDISRTPVDFKTVVQHALKAKAGRLGLGT